MHTLIKILKSIETIVNLLTDIKSQNEEIKAEIQKNTKYVYRIYKQNE